MCIYFYSTDVVFAKLLITSIILGHFYFPSLIFHTWKAYLLFRENCAYFESLFFERKILNLEKWFVTPFCIRGLTHVTLANLNLSGFEFSKPEFTTTFSKTY